MTEENFSHAIALTGGISTGKSTVGNLLKLHGYLIIDADEIAHRLLDLHALDIAKIFGDRFVQDGKVLRKELGKIIFSDAKEKKRLEDFIHPKIKEEIIKEAVIFEQAGKPYFIDIPLFFESMHYNIKESVVIYTPYEIQVKRLMKRDNISEAEAKLKISNQMDIEEKKALATYVIDNSTNLKDLQREVETFIRKI